MNPVCGLESTGLVLEIYQYNLSLTPLIIVVNVLGIATGVLIDDALCQLLKLSRSQFAYGMKVSAVAIWCQDPRVWDSMTDAGTPCPVRGLIGAEPEQYWADNHHEIPEGSRYKASYVQQVKVEETPQGDMDGLKNFGLMALSLLLLF